LVFIRFAPFSTALKNFLAYALVCIFLLTSCSRQQSPEITSGEYFSLRKFFESESAKLQSSGTGIKKIITRDGTSQELIMDSVAWTNELKLFIESDLNKKSWTGLYHVDSTLSDSALVIRYSANDSMLQVKHVEILFVRGDVYEIRIESRLKNFYYQSAMLLHYLPGKSYRINGEQVLRFASMQTYLVEGIFLNPAAASQPAPAE